MIFHLTFNLKWIFNYFDSPYALNPGSLNYNDASTSPRMAREFIKQQGAGQKTNQWQTGISSSIKFTPGSYLESSVYFVSRDLLNPIPGRIIDLKRNVGGLRTAYTHSFPFSNFKLNFVTGTDLEIQSDFRTEYINLGLPEDFLASYDPSEIFNNLQYGDKLLDQHEKVFGIGPFVQSELVYLPFTFLLGLRYDNYRFSVDDNFLEDGSDDSGKRVMDKFSPVAGINYRINNLTKLFLNYATSFQTPATTELSNRPDGQGGFNPALLPENIHSSELGFLKLGLFNF
jgi:iron complex outermembrane recepter protein